MWSASTIVSTSKNSRRRRTTQRNAKYASTTREEKKGGKGRRQSTCVSTPSTLCSHENESLCIPFSHHTIASPRLLPPPPSQPPPSPSSVRQRLVASVHFVDLPTEILVHVINVIDNSSSSAAGAPHVAICSTLSSLCIPNVQCCNTFERQWRTMVQYRSVCKSTRVAAEMWLRSVVCAHFNKFAWASRTRSALSSILSAAHLLTSVRSVSFYGWGSVVDDESITSFVKSICVKNSPCRQGRGNVHLNVVTDNSRTTTEELSTSYSPNLLTWASLSSRTLDEHEFSLLRDLDVSTYNVTNQGVQTIASLCPHLISLCLRDTMVNDNGLEAIASSCADLEHISVNYCDWLGGRGLVSIAHKCTRLKSVRAGMLTESIAVGIVEHCGHRLQYLEFHTFALGLRDSGVEKIATQCPQLRTLIIHTRGMACTTDAAVYSIARHCPLLHTAVLDFDPMSDDAIEALARGCPNLEYLRIVEIKAHYLTNASICAIVRTCRRLVTLDVRYCVLLTDVSMNAIAHHSTSNLKHVFLPSTITDDAIELVKRTCPHLRKIRRHSITRA